MPKFCHNFLLIYKQGLISPRADLKSNSNEFGFIGFLFQSAFRGYLICKFSSRFDPSICLLTNRCLKSILIWALTCKSYYYKYRQWNLSILVSFESYDHKLSIYSKSPYLDTIWLVNLRILTKTFFSVIFCLLILEKSQQIQFFSKNHDLYIKILLFFSSF